MFPDIAVKPRYCRNEEKCAGYPEENIPENKYDTLGLEAAYLATGQARRAEAIR